MKASTGDCCFAQFQDGTCALLALSRTSHGIQVITPQTEFTIPLADGRAITVDAACL
jgi:hypothetical protein